MEILERKEQSVVVLHDGDEGSFGMDLDKGGHVAFNEKGRL